jgi:putative transposase
MNGDAFRLLLLILAVWRTAQEQAAVAYLIEEDRILRARVGRRRLRLTDEERRRLARRGKPLGRRLTQPVVRQNLIAELTG